MRGWRLLRSLGNWDKFTLAQLKDELAMRGLKRSGSKPDLIARLEACEMVKQQPAKQKAQPTHQQEANSQAKVQRKTMGKELLIAEIKKRRPNEAVNSRFPKEKLVEILEQLLQNDAFAYSAVPSIRSLLPRLNSSASSSIAVGDVLDIAAVLVDLERVEQNELNVLINSEIADFYRMWSLLYGGIEGMSGQQLLTLLRLIHLFSEILKKSPTTGSPVLDTSALSQLTERLSLFKSSLSLLDLSAAATLLSQLSSAKSITDAISAFQSEVLVRLQANTELTLPPSQLFPVLESLPEAAFDLNPAAVSTLVTTLFPANSSFSSARVLSALHKFYQIKAPIPFPLAVGISALGKDFLKRLHPVSLYDVLRLVCEKRCLTVNILKMIWGM